MSTVGLPKYVGSTYELAVHLARDLDTISAVYRNNGEEPPAGVQGQYYLGFAGSPFLCVHGENGVVSQVDQGYGARPLATGLENFLRLLAVVDAGVREFEDREYDGIDIDPRAHFAQVETQTVARRYELEPGAAPQAVTAWRSFFADGTGNARFLLVHSDAWG